MKLSCTHKNKLQVVLLGHNVTPPYVVFAYIKLKNGFYRYSKGKQIYCFMTTIETMNTLFFHGNENEIYDTFILANNLCRLLKSVYKTFAFFDTTLF